MSRSVHDAVELHVRRRPEAVAVEWNGTRLSYGELAARAAGVHRALRACGRVEGRPVAVRLPRGPDQVASVLGALSAGAHVVCMGAGDVGDRGRAVLDELRPAALVGADDDLARWFRDEAGGATLRPGDGAPVIPPVTPPVPCAPEDLAYIAYTSGTTGRPKGIPHTHGTLVQFVTWFAAEFGIGPGSRVAQWALPGYDANLVEIFAALTSGATLCPVPERTRTTPERLVGWLAAERITHFQTVPSFIRTCLPGLAGLPHLGHLLLAGEVLPGELAAALRSALPGARLVNLYGPTESILATWFEVDRRVRGTVPVGRPVPGREVLVVDEHDLPCPPGATGEIVVMGPHVTTGYVGAAAGGNAAFRPLAGRHAFRTGDRGRFREDGVLEYGGRGDSQVKVNGSRLELAEVEAVLAAQASVADCAVSAVTGADGLVSRLVAHVVPRGDGADQAAWRGALRGAYGASVPPVVFKILDELPRNVGGKVDRSRLEGERDPARN
ncbi:amino acid adenylation domain-containing protein [Planomonospora corallina]|uniref:Amino acid adenylation domain-containing protein n=1 Tax=Planomonospora corallina TaxID=1806052 RepID=A0ABV8I2F7_9ACTN